jgi:hypothetical protein
MEKELLYFKMETNMKEYFIKIIYKKEVLIIKMEINMKDVFRVFNLMEKEYLLQSMDINIQGILLKELEVVREYKYLRQESVMKDNF